MLQVAVPVHLLLGSVLYACSPCRSACKDAVCLRQPLHAAREPKPFLGPVPLDRHGRGPYPKLAYMDGFFHAGSWGCSPGAVWYILHALDQPSIRACSFRPRRCWGLDTRGGPGNSLCLWLKAMQAQAMQMCIKRVCHEGLQAGGGTEYALSSCRLLGRTRQIRQCAPNEHLWRLAQQPCCHPSNGSPSGCAVAPFLACRLMPVTIAL